MTRQALVHDLGPSPWELFGFLAYLVALTTTLSYGFLWSVRFPEFALGLIPVVCLAILWDDRRREISREAMPVPSMDAANLIDSLWDSEIDS